MIGYKLSLKVRVYGCVEVEICLSFYYNLYGKGLVMG